MKKVLLIYIFIIFNINIYANNINSNLVDITIKNDFIFKDDKFNLKTASEEGIYYYEYVYYQNENNIILINDNYYDSIEKIYFNEKNNRYYFMKKVRRNLPDIDGEGRGVFGYEYNLDIYKKYDNFFLQIITLKKAPNGTKYYLSKYDGFEGNEVGKELTYPYRDFKNMQKLDNDLVIDDNQILTSLEEFIKADNTIRDYEPPISFKESSFKLETLKSIFNEIPISTKTVAQYNDIAYYLQQANANDEAIFLLEKIIEKFPNRTVAYLNLADAYLGKNESEKAKANYEKYINLMKQDNKESKIPQRVLEFK